ncbi:putative sulfate permease C3H7.02 [Schizosaccharomyces pombe]|uniref:Probable sulfate permease C869.05c n=1 Tax=Schizosaccharomyces pombe (strain 972 / ATCC 24843) TaxID=284812 RepID=SULH2_SCHPO|nr:putative sulfate transporter [Schizosaccharomyces pombe]Q9URY8.1 RecName: Full=Probable sulfate permease C869.05c [Schizosaccharomyces pombe 972h-]CAB60015.1 sulfate transporter (predicted) [Schizosaccharomyces pombe]|eukprot:NP_595014.1 putative sulfate transporter [Schizosaccharomyces pombe]
MRAWGWVRNKFSSEDDYNDGASNKDYPDRFNEFDNSQNDHNDYTQNNAQFQNAQTTTFGRTISRVKAYYEIPEDDELDELASIPQWFKKNVTSNIFKNFLHYLKSLFPIIEWLPNYNPYWLINDLIAGITVGCVVVPQGMSYAKVATLPSEYGLYSSFVGVAIYCFFATSKDVSIGPVAVMSLITAKVIANVMAKDETYTAPQIATCLALLAGAITCGIGLLRLGFIIEFIPVPAVAGFTTGSALNILSGQVPALMGYKNKVTAKATYMVIIQSLKHLPDTTVDAAFGLVSLFILFFTKYMCQYLGKRYPRWQQAFFLTNTLRSAVVVIVGTAISYAICKHHRSDPPISIIKTVPRGFQHVGVPLITKKLCRDLASELPVSVIVLLLEHISIAKSFGRVNDYRIVPDQELIAMGVTNLIGIFFNAYPATGSFSRSAIKAKAGVKTPIAGIFTAAVVILSLYCLTDAFYYIPNAILSAVIIHAVTDLILPMKQTILFWRLQPLEACIFFISVIVSVFSSIENGIYVSVCLAAALLLLRIAKPHGSFLGKIQAANKYGSDNIANVRDIYVPLEMKEENPNLEIQSPPPGVFIFRLQESFTYPNASRVSTMISRRIKDLTRRGIDNIYVKDIDRPWNVPRQRKKKENSEIEDLRPLLQAIIFDFSAVNNLDTTAVQSLIDIRKELEIYANETVEFHFTNIRSGWIKRTLVAAGFGKPKGHAVDASVCVEVAAPLRDANLSAESSRNLSRIITPIYDDEEGNVSGHIYELDGKNNSDLSMHCQKGSNQVEIEFVEFNSRKYPFFHVDVASAVVDLQHRLLSPQKSDSFGSLKEGGTTTIKKIEN